MILYYISRKFTLQRQSKLERLATFDSQVANRWLYEISRWSRNDRNHEKWRESVLLASIPAWGCSDCQLCRYRRRIAGGHPEERWALSARPIASLPKGWLVHRRRSRSCLGQLHRLFAPTASASACSACSTTRTQCCYLPGWNKIEIQFSNARIKETKILNLSIYVVFFIFSLKTE